MALEEYNGKKVLVTATGDDGSAYEIEGTVESGNELGLLIKPKGKTNLNLIEASKIVEVKLSSSAPASKKLKAKILRVVELGQARAHLLERHGYKVADINAMSEEDALAFHESLDHKALDLGHTHGTREATPVEAAIAAAEGDADEA